MRGVRQYQNKGNESDGDHFNGCLTFVSYAYFKVYTSTSNCFYPHSSLRTMLTRTVRMSITEISCQKKIQKNEPEIQQKIEIEK